MKVDEATRKAVNEVLARMAEAMAAKDINAFIKLFSKDFNILTITPEEEGMYVGPTQLKEGMEKTFNEAESLSLKYGWTSIRASGPVARVSSHVYYNIKKKGKQEVSLSARMTGVLEKDNDSWLWTQFHLSVPVSIEAPEETAEEKAAKEEAAKAEAAKAKEAEPAAEAKPAEAEEKSPEETDIFWEMP
jgi:uncharacterized protein (TIGR02246 family)